MATENDPKKINSEFVSDTLLQYFNKIKIKNVEIYPQNVVKIEIREWIFDCIPRLEIYLLDDGRLIDKYPIEENDEIEIELSLNKEEESPINSTFLLNDYEFDKSNANDVTGYILHITGFLKCEELLFIERNRSFKEQTTSDVVTSIASEVGLNSDVRIQTNDKQTWLQINTTNNDFLHHISNKGFYREDDALFCYTDRYSNMVYTSLKEETSKVIDFNAYQDSYRSNEFTDITDDKNNNTKTGNKTTDDENTLYYSTFRVMNMSSTANKKGGYGQQLSYYDLENEVILESKSNNYELTTKSFKDSAYSETVVKKYVVGIDTNVHNNYKKSELQNRYIKNSFFNNYFMLTIRPNNKVELFDKVFVNVPTSDGYSLDGVNSGEYLICGIINSASKEGLYQMTLIMSRNGINATESIQEEFETKLA